MCCLPPILLGVSFWFLGSLAKVFLQTDFLWPLYAYSNLCPCLSPVLVFLTTTACSYYTLARCPTEEFFVEWMNEWEAQILFFHFLSSLPVSLFILSFPHFFSRASQVALVVKNPPANAGDLRDSGSIPGLGRSGEGNGNPLQYSCLGKSMDVRAWQAAVQRVGHNWSDLTHTLFFKVYVALINLIMKIHIHVKKVFDNT